MYQSTMGDRNVCDVNNFKISSNDLASARECGTASVSSQGPGEPAH